MNKNTLRNIPFIKVIDLYLNSSLLRIDHGQIFSLIVYIVFLLCPYINMSIHSQPEKLHQLFTEVQILTCGTKALRNIWGITCRSAPMIPRNVVHSVLFFCIVQLRVYKGCVFTMFLSLHRIMKVISAHLF